MARYTKAGLERAEVVRDFGRRFVVHKKDRWAGKPFELEPWQWDHIIKPLYGAMHKGRRRYKRALIGLPRWSGKSELLSLMVMHHLFIEAIQEGECYVVASNERQANIIFQTVKRMIQANPRLAAMCDIYKREIWVKETGCVFKALPADADSAQGFHPSFCAVDEVHVHKSHALIEAMISGMVAREEALLVAITTAGPKREGVLWDMLRGGEDRKAWRDQDDAYVYWVGASDSDDITDPRVWRKANPASWITDDMLRSQFEALPRRSFERYHCNRFPLTGDASKALTPKQIARCVKQPSEFDFEQPFALGIDGAQSGDAFALIAAQIRDGKPHFREWVFDTPPEDTGFYDLVQIEQLIAELYAKHHPLIVIDPARLLLMAQHLDQSYGVPLVAVPQTNAAMCPATSLMQNAVRGGDAHLGGCPKLAEHLGNAVLLDRGQHGERYGSEGKGANKQRIDAAIAGALALYALETQDAAPDAWVMSW
jgi:phage terminase large subunit-like protein